MQELAEALVIVLNAPICHYIQPTCASGKQRAIAGQERDIDNVFPGILHCLYRRHIILIARNDYCDIINIAEKYHIDPKINIHGFLVAKCPVAKVEADGTGTSEFNRAMLSLNSILNGVKPGKASFDPIKTAFKPLIRMIKLCVEVGLRGNSKMLLQQIVFPSESPEFFSAFRRVGNPPRNRINILNDVPIRAQAVALCIGCDIDKGIKKSSPLRRFRQVVPLIKSIKEFDNRMAEIFAINENANAHSLTLLRD